MTSLPPFGRRSKPRARGLGAAHEINHAAHRPLRGARDFGDHVRILAVHGGKRPAFKGRAALAFVDVDHDRALAAECLKDGQAHQAEAPAPMTTIGSAGYTSESFRNAP